MIELGLPYVTLKRRSALTLVKGKYSNRFKLSTSELIFMNEVSFESKFCTDLHFKSLDAMPHKEGSSPHPNKALSKTIITNISVTLCPILIKFSTNKWLKLLYVADALAPTKRKYCNHLNYQ